MQARLHEDKRLQELAQLTDQRYSSLL